MNTRKLTKIALTSLASIFTASFMYAEDSTVISSQDFSYSTEKVVAGEVEAGNFTITKYELNDDGDYEAVLYNVVFEDYLGDSSSGTPVYFKWVDGSLVTTSTASEADITAYKSSSDNVRILKGSYGDTTATYNVSYNFIDTANNGIYFQNGGHLNSMTGDFIGNDASIGGGAVYVYNSGVYIEELISDFIGNTTTENGGAVYLTVYGNNTPYIDSIEGDFIGNYAASDGGAVYVAGSSSSGGYSTISSIVGDFIGNTAGRSGGAIYNYAVTPTENGADSNNGKAYIESITGDFIGNYAYGDGGAIYNSITLTASTGTADISDVTGDFMGNTAEGLGGAVFNNGTIAFVADTANVTFTGNTDSTGSNAIYNTGTVTMSAVENYAVIVNDGISGNGTMNLTGGNIYFNNKIEGQTISLTSGNLSLGDVTIDSTSYSASLISSSISVASGATLSIVASGVELGATSSITLNATSNLVFGEGASLDLVEGAVINVYIGDVDLSNFSYTLATFATESDLNTFLTELALTEDENPYLTVSSDDTALAYGTDFEVSVSGLSLNITSVSAAVPEPSTYAMILGVLALGFAYYRRKQK